MFISIVKTMTNISSFIFSFSPPYFSFGITNINNTIKTLKDNGFWIYGTVMNGEDYRDVNYDGKTCLVIGNEEKGMSKLVKESCDFFISIPISPKIDSLNASVAAGI